MLFNIHLDVQDLIDRGEKLYLPMGSPLYHYYKSSPLKQQIFLATQFDQNVKEQLYILNKGQEPKEMLDKLLSSGEQTIYLFHYSYYFRTKHFDDSLFNLGGAFPSLEEMTLVSFPRFLTLYGFEPFRVAKGFVIRYYKL